MGSNQASEFSSFNLSVWCHLSAHARKRVEM
jgi:hypothetical protein